METTKERDTKGTNGYLAVAVGVIVVIAGLAFIGLSTQGSNPNGGGVAFGLVVVVAALFCSKGVVVVAPNTAVVLTVFGRYSGTLRSDGLWWVNPFANRWHVSLRVRNFDSDTLKVNDAVGNPVEIAAVINWQVRDTARAVFDVQNYQDFVSIQAEAAVRHVASEYPYDAHADGERSLRGDADEVTATLRNELQQRLMVAGVDVLEARLRRLAYAPEIAGEMLRKQQAAAVVAAQELIVDGALGMVRSALAELESGGGVILSNEQRAVLTSNLLIVLVSDRGVQPVINAGM
ncbi:MAG: SPFH domain-containing protein [Acidimicrobiia bacterium]